MRALPSAAILLALTLPACEKKAEPAPEAIDPAAFPAAQRGQPAPQPVFPVPAATASAAPESSGAPAAPSGEAPTAVAPRAAMAVAKPGASAAPAPAPEEAPAEPVQGAVVKDAPFAVWLQGSGAYEVGKPSAVTAVVTANDPFKCNDKYPYKLKLGAPPPGVTFPSDVVRGMQVGPKRSTMAVPFTAAEAGAKTIAGELSFSVCTDEKCLVEKRNVSVTVNVK